MKNNLLPALLILVLLGSCSSSKKTSASGSSASGSQAEMLDENSFELLAISDDDTYGYTEKNPVKVGGATNNSGPLNERKSLNALLGPGGQTLTYNRRGSCCPVKSPNGLMGSGLLDMY